MNPAKQRAFENLLVAAKATLAAVQLAESLGGRPPSRMAKTLEDVIDACERADIEGEPCKDAGDWYDQKRRLADHLSAKLWAEKNSSAPRAARIAQLERQLEDARNVGD